MTHAEAIAALIIADAAIATAKGRTLEGRVWYLPNLHTALRRCERAGFEHGDLVRETMKTTVVGHGYPFPPSKRVTPAMRTEIVDLVKASGLEVNLVKASGAYRIVAE